MPHATLSFPTRDALDPGAELGKFLRSRRARLKPADVGLYDDGGFRRVPGLRREELARAAGISVAYYVRLEQGTAGNVSASVIDALARTLRLDASENAHLRNLLGARARTAVPAADADVDAAPADARVETLGHLLGAMRGPAYLNGPRGEVLAWNALASAFFGDWSDLPLERRNWGLLLFGDRSFRDIYVDWRAKAYDYVGYLRAYAGRHPEDERLRPLVAELTGLSADFGRLWASQDVKEPSNGRKRLRHPGLGELELRYENVWLPMDPEWSIVTYFAEAGSPEEAALRTLA